MAEVSFNIHYEEFSSVKEMDPIDQNLIAAALDARKGSYSPYSHFQVGAALLLADGTIVKGANQENIAYPSGLCAERSAMFAAGANYPDTPMLRLAIAASDMASSAKVPPRPAAPAGR